MENPARIIFFLILYILSVTQLNFILILLLVHQIKFPTTENELNGTKYSKMDQVKLVEDSF